MPTHPGSVVGVGRKPVKVDHFDAGKPNSEIPAAQPPRGSLLQDRPWLRHRVGRHSSPPLLTSSRKEIERAKTLTCRHTQANTGRTLGLLESFASTARVLREYCGKTARNPGEWANTRRALGKYRANTARIPCGHWANTGRKLTVKNSLAQVAFHSDIAPPSMAGLKATESGPMPADAEPTSAEVFSALGPASRHNPASPATGETRAHRLNTFFCATPQEDARRVNIFARRRFRPKLVFAKRGPKLPRIGPNSPKIG